MKVGQEDDEPRIALSSRERLAVPRVEWERERDVAGRVSGGAAEPASERQPGGGQALRVRLRDEHADEALLRGGEVAGDTEHPQRQPLGRAIAVEALAAPAWGEAVRLEEATQHRVVEAARAFAVAVVVEAAEGVEALGGVEEVGGGPRLPLPPLAKRRVALPRLDRPVGVGEGRGRPQVVRQRQASHCENASLVECQTRSLGVQLKCSFRGVSKC